MRSLTLGLLALLVIAIWLRIDFFFNIVYFFAAIFLLARFWITRAIRQLDVRRSFLDRAFVGDDVGVDLRVSNNGWLPIPWLAIAESVPTELAGAPPQGHVLSLGPHEVWNWAYSFRCLKRGYYTLGPLRTQLGDLLGIENYNLEAGGRTPIIVYPRVMPLDELGLPTRSPQVVLPSRSYLFEDPNRVVGVRGYQRGDAPRRMHWTATARTGQLQVKQYQPAIARETMICLDMEQDDYDNYRRYDATELAIVIAASLATHLVSREGLPVGLATEAMDPLAGGQRLITLQPRAEQAHLLGNLLEVLARVQIASKSSYVNLLRQSVVGLPWGATVVAITGRASGDLLPGLLMLRRSGFAVTLLLVQASDLTPELRRQSEAVGIPTRRIWIEGTRLARA